MSPHRPRVEHTAVVAVETILAKPSDPHARDPLEVDGEPQDRPFVRRAAGYGTARSSSRVPKGPDWCSRFVAGSKRRRGCAVPPTSSCPVEFVEHGRSDRSHRARAARNADAASKTSFGRFSSLSQLTQTLALVGREPGPSAVIDLRSPEPHPQRLKMHTELLGNLTERRPLRRMLVIQHLPHHPLTQLGRIPPTSSNS